MGSTATPSPLPSFPSSLPICDPHFHVWDNVGNPKNLNLGGIADGPLATYLSAHYLRSAASLPLASAVHVETVVGQDGSFYIDSVGESRFVARDTAAFAPRPLGIVAFVHLARADAAAEIDAHAAAAGAQFVGVRMIMNYHPTDKSLTWAQVSRDFFSGESDAELSKNFPLLAARGLVFDSHANWFQLKSAAAFFASQPRTPIVLDHLGCPKLGQKDVADADVISEWKAGMGALARDVPALRVKISGLEYVRAGWLVQGSPERAVVRELVHWVLDTFGADRCMVASNFPVDLHMGGADLPELYASLYDLLKTRSSGEPTSDADLRKVFHDVAHETYGLQRLVKQ